MNGFSFKSFITGFPIGMAFCLTFGPVFFSLLKNGLQHGWRAAVLMSLGVTISDIVLLTGALSGVETLLPKESKVGSVIQVIAGLVLIGLGIASILKKKADTEGGQIVEKPKSAFHFISIGFFLNIVNPLNFAEWVGIATYLKTVEKNTFAQSLSFFSGALLGVFLIETAIGLSASFLRKYLTNKIIHIFNVVIGILFIASGIILFVKMFF